MGSLTQSKKALLKQNEENQRKMKEIVEKYKRAQIAYSEKQLICKQNEDKMAKMQQQIDSLQANETKLKTQLKSQSIANLNNSLHSLSNQMKSLRKANESLQSKMKSMAQSENAELQAKQH